MGGATYCLFKLHICGCLLKPKSGQEVFGAKHLPSRTFSLLGGGGRSILKIPSFPSSSSHLHLIPLLFFKTFFFLFFSLMYVGKKIEKGLRLFFLRRHHKQSFTKRYLSIFNFIFIPFHFNITPIFPPEGLLRLVFFYLKKKLESNIKKRAKKKKKHQPAEKCISVSLASSAS